MGTKKQVNLAVCCVAAMTANMAVPLDVHVGVDVGGTNTDAVVIHTGSVIGWAKHVTTADITTGVRQAIREALNHTLEHQPSGNWGYVSQKILPSTHLCARSIMFWSYLFV